MTNLDHLVNFNFCILDEDSVNNIVIFCTGTQDQQGLVTEFSKDMFKVQTGQDAVAVRSATINVEINALRKKKQEIEKNIANCPNPVLQDHLRKTLIAVEEEIRTKEMEIEAFAMFS